MKFIKGDTLVGSGLDFVGDLYLRLRIFFSLFYDAKWHYQCVHL